MYLGSFNSFFISSFILNYLPFYIFQRTPTNGRRLHNKTTSCKPTTADVYGPYYRPGSPKLSSLCSRDAAREPRNNLIVNGYVYESNCRTTIPKVRIEIWQADRKGSYEDNGQCRGYFETNKSGYYRFTTVFPGKYQISMEEAQEVAEQYNRPIGDRYRPAHIHFKVNGRRGHKSLVTQMYFYGDENLGMNDSCVICNSDNSDLLLRPRRICRQNGCENVIRFDIVLAKGNGITVGEG